MAYKISIGIDWQGQLDYQALCEKVQIAEAAGMHSAWVPEAWGRDAFTILTLLADKTKRINLGTAIVNTYARLPRWPSILPPWMRSLGGACCSAWGRAARR